MQRERKLREISHQAVVHQVPLRSLHQNLNHFWLKDESVIFWPVRLEKDLLAAIILTTEPDIAGHYLEEGEIFIPQIALGLRRTKLFAEIEERSRIDGLTQLYLRRYFLERFQVEIQRAKRYSSVFSILAMMRIFFSKLFSVTRWPFNELISLANS